MIPTEAGEYELPTVKFVYFDPKKKAYETVEAKPPKISVLKEGTLRPGGPAQRCSNTESQPCRGSRCPEPGWVLPPSLQDGSIFLSFYLGWP